MYYGAAYYPEHWPEKDWERDAELMRQAGFSVARLGEFAWSRFEPKEGQWEFGWLDRVLDILARNGIKALLCTPTAAPPPWLVKKHPGILPVDRNGVTVGPGSRRHYCPNNQVYRSYVQEIVAKMSQHYRDNPAVVGWQIDNEFGCHDTARCYCDSCEAAFRQWLQKKYDDDIAAMNRAWGSDFWSQEYTEWDEVPLPLKTPAPHNPSFLLDFYRFSSAAVVEFQELQRNIIKATAPHQFVTHNMMRFHELDYYDLAKELDFVGWDSYPGSGRPLGSAVVRDVALTHDMMRGLKGRNFWMLEQKCGPSSRNGSYTAPPVPGQVRLWTYQAIGHGADGVVYFRWRAARSGTEQCLGGILSAAGRPTRTYDEIRAVGEELARISDHVADSTVPAEVAILFSYQIGWAVSMQSRLFGPGFSYREHLAKYYRGFFDHSVPVDVVAPERDLSKYKLVVAPALFLTNEAILRNLYGYVERGGCLIVTLRSGVKDWTNKAATEELPGCLSRLLQIQIEECDSLQDQSNQIALNLPGMPPVHYACSNWCDVIRARGAAVYATYERGHYAGAPAITASVYGKGRAIYVGTEIAHDGFYSDIVRWACGSVGIKPLLSAPVADVEALVRQGPGGEFLFLLNHNLTEARTATTTKSYKSLLNGRRYAGAVTLPPGGVEVLAAEA